MDAKLKAKAMTDDQLDGVAGGYSPSDYNYPDRFQITPEEAEMLNKQHHKGDGTGRMQPTLNTYSLKYL